MDCVYFWWIHFGFLIYLFYILFFPSFSFPAQPPDDSQHNLHLLSGGSGLVREGNQRKKNESKLRTHHEKYDLQSWFFVSHKFLDSSFLRLFTNFLLSSSLLFFGRKWTARKQTKDKGKRERESWCKKRREQKKNKNEINDDERWPLG